MNEFQLLHTKKLDKLINKFILHSKRFVDWSAFSYGAADLLRHPEPNNKFTYDHEYFNFTKSTKSLISIRALLKLKNNEDVLILVRSIFENYLSTRYLNKNEENFEEFTIVLLKVFTREYIYDSKNNIIKDRNGNIIANGILNPSKFTLGKDRSYYYEFYDFLSKVGHSNFGIINFYRNQNLTFTVEKNNFPVLTRFFVIFVFTKLFEHVVTVEGEDFYDFNEEKKCYDLVIESLRYQDQLIVELIKKFEEDTEINPHKKFFNKKMKEMLKGMKKSLKEELGSVNKDFFDN